MLQLRPTCKNCNAALPPNSAAAMICTFECTFCRSCVENILDNVYKNYRGDFCSQPIRPKNDWKGRTISTRILQAQQSSIVPWIQPFTSGLPNQSNQSSRNSDDHNLILDCA